MRKIGSGDERTREIERIGVKRHRRMRASIPPKIESTTQMAKKRWARQKTKLTEISYRNTVINKYKVRKLRFEAPNRKRKNKSEENMLRQRKKRRGTKYSDSSSDSHKATIKEGGNSNQCKDVKPRERDQGLGTSIAETSFV